MTTGMLYVLLVLLALCVPRDNADAFLHTANTISRKTSPATVNSRRSDSTFSKKKAPISSSSSTSSTTSTRLLIDLWDRMEIEEDDEPQWYLLNCVAGLELDLLQQCRMKCGNLPDVVKFVVPTVTKTRSHGAKRMVQDTKVKYQGYVFAKLRLTRDTYTAIQSMDLCRSWMGTINMKGYKKLPPAPLPLTEEEIENFDLENFKWMQQEQEIVAAAAVKTKERTVIMDTEDYDMEENRILTEIEEEVENVYKGLKVEDMVKVTSKGKFYNEDGIVRRLKEGKVLIRFFTYGSVFDEWLDPTDVRKLSEAEILKGLGGPSAPITQQDLDGPQQGRGDERDREDRFDRRNQVGAFGGERDRKQDRTERRFRNDDGNLDERSERDNWSWYQQKERRSREGGYSDGEEHIRGSADQGKSRGNFWAEGDEDSQWGRNNSQRNSRTDQRQPRDNRRQQQNDDWSSFISKSSAPRNKREPPTKEETDDFFASLMSDLSSDFEGDAQSNGDSGSDSSDDDFFASLVSEIDDDKPQSRASPSTKLGEDDDDDFFASLEKEIRGSTRQNKSTPKRGETRKKEFNAEEELDDIFAELSMDTAGSPSSSSSSFDDGEDDFFASLELELAADLGERKPPKSKNYEDTTSVDSDTDDFFASLESELAGDLNQEANEDVNNGSGGSWGDDDDFFLSLEAEHGSDALVPANEPMEKKTKSSSRKSKPDDVPSTPEEGQTKHVPGPKDIDVGALQKRTIPELKDMLRERGLKVSGKKSELIERLTTS